ncbi:MAG: branched-chain amino acid transporter permease [Frankiales bacterium]|nr:branched-chain amino acid transporter permease [Frankiales bacterium]
MIQYGTTLVTGITNGLDYAVLGVTFGLIFFTTGRFHFAYGLFYGLAGMLCSWGNNVHGWSLPFAIIIGILAATIGGMLTELIVYRAFDRRAPGLSLLGIFIASLGLVVAGEATMYLFFDESPSYFIDIFNSRTFSMGKVPLPEVKLATAIFCIVVLGGLAFMRSRTSAGRKMRAVEANPVLAQTYGIKVKRVYLLVFAIGSAVAGVLGVLYSSTYAATPTMGDATIIYAFVVAFLGRGRGPIFNGMIGLALGILEALIGQWFGLVLRNLAVFLVLFIFIALRPYLGGFRSMLPSRRRELTTA